MNYWSDAGFQNLLHGVAAVGILSLIAKLHQWDESAMFFDGTSLGEYTRLCFILILNMTRAQVYSCLE